jgi:ornithine carbamoyltransferase
MPTSDFLSVADLSPAQLKRVLSRASDLRKGKPAPQVLKGKAVALLFQKPSLRTKLSFDLAVHQLGGHAIYTSPDEVGLGKREPVEDVARVLSRYVDCIVARVFGHDIIERLAACATVPVINALSDGEHPCQALADLQTAQESLGSLKGKTIAFVGDGNNCAASLLLGAAATGANYRIASPEGYELREQVMEKAQAIAKATGAKIAEVGDPKAAVAGADVVYTDVWTSMGQEEEAQKRRKAFMGYQVNAALMSKAKKGAIFLHPLPAHHGEEIGIGMLDHPASRVFHQAENRLHAQKSLLIEIFGKA